MVLSARAITDASEISKMKRHGYHYVNYRTLFDAIKKNLGTYALDADQSYLAFLFDFIRTIENRYSTNNMELKRFFYENRRQINWLKAEYEKFENQILQLRKERIGELLTLIKARTGADWWAWQGWDLGVEFKTVLVLRPHSNKAHSIIHLEYLAFTLPFGIVSIMSHTARRCQKRSRVVNLMNTQKMPHLEFTFISL